MIKIENFSAFNIEHLKEVEHFMNTGEWTDNAYAMFGREVEETLFKKITRKSSFISIVASFVAMGMFDFFWNLQYVVI